MLYIHRHHFPIALLQWRENHLRPYLATSLSHEDANSISVNDLGRNRFTEFTNSVYHLNNTGLKKTQSTRKLLTSAYKKQYVQSPFATHDEITSYVKLLQKKKRTQQIITIMPEDPIMTNLSLPICDALPTCDPIVTTYIIIHSTPARDI